MDTDLGINKIKEAGNGNKENHKRAVTLLEAGQKCRYDTPGGVHPVATGGA